MKSKSSSTKPKLCFILGIDQRSGTNFLFKLLGKHPQCIGPGPIWEDNFLKHSQLLCDYTELLYNSWNPKWEIEQNIGGQEKLLEYFGKAIEKFLRLQLYLKERKNSRELNKDNPHNTKILLSKTPSVECLENFYTLFPNAYLILLIRDGRAVVESGVQSFGWDYESAFQRWQERADIIINFCKKYDPTQSKFLLLKYEDIVSNQDRELFKIFNYLNLDPELYDYKSANSLGVIGSSELKEQAGEVHWKTTEKKEDFNPLARFENWDQSKHQRFNWYAEKQMKELGYTINDFGRNKYTITLKNNFISLIENIKSNLRKVKNSFIN